MTALIDSLATARAAPPALAAVRADALAALHRDGLPGARDEAWKYANLRAFGQRRFVDGDCGAHARRVDPAWLLPAAATAARIVFVNGVFRADLSAAGAAGGLAVERFSTRPDELAALLREDIAGDAFARIAAALALDGVRIRVADGVRVEAPLHLVFAGAPADVDVAWGLRCDIAIGAGARLALVEHHLATAPHAHFGNAAVDYRVADGARLDLVQVQDAAESATLVRRAAARLGAGAQLNLHTIEVGAQFARQDFAVELAGRGARLASRGVFALRGRQHGETRLDVVHAARDAVCDVAWRGVADQRSRGVFRGAIAVAAGADGADAQLTSKNLLLSAQAEIDTQPVLEIHADEVKAAHGATVGQLDEAALFYLRSRGLPLDLARRVLVSAFCGAVLGGLDPALRERIDALLAARLPQAEAA